MYASGNTIRKNVSTRWSLSYMLQPSQKRETAGRFGQPAARASGAGPSRTGRPLTHRPCPLACQIRRRRQRRPLAGGAVGGRDRDRAGDQEERDRELLECARRTQVPSKSLAPGPPAKVLISGHMGVSQRTLY